MNIKLNVCVKCGGTEYEGTFTAYNALFGHCKKCKSCAIILKSSPEYEEYCRKTAAEQALSKLPPTITCPYCKSTDTKKITTTKKFFSTGVLGLASSTLGKNFHCNRCKADF